MPIRAEFRRFYGREWREVVRPRILKRAQYSCEACWAPNNYRVERVGGWWLNPMLGLWIRASAAGSPDVNDARRFDPGERHSVWIVLTIAHLNHVAGDDGDDNLKALCQWCHLNYDKQHHAETRATRKDAARPLLREAAS
jgi:hypothetical protein